MTRFSTHLINAEISLPKTLQITSEAFMKSYTQNDIGKGISNPLLMQICMEMLANDVPNEKVVFESIFIDKAGLKVIEPETKQVIKVTDEELLNCNPEALIITKGIAKISVEGLNDKFRPSIAVIFDDKGIQLAYGTMVNVCTNYTIFGAERRFSTYGKGKNRRYSVEDLLQQMKSLFPKTEQLLAQDLDLIEKLKQEKLTRNQWNSFVDGLYCQSHYVNRMRLTRRIREVPENIKALPITANTLAAVCAESYAPSHEVYEWDGNISNKWNAINYFTEVCKTSQGHNHSTLLEANHKWTQLVINNDFSKI